MDEPTARPGARFIAEVPEGSELRAFGDFIVVVHPDHPPRMFDLNGEEVPLGDLSP